MSEETKAEFYAALNKTKYQLYLKPKFKVIALGDLNATISSHSNESWMRDDILGCNNYDRVEKNGNGERLLGWCLKQDDDREFKIQKQKNTLEVLIFANFAIFAKLNRPKTKNCTSNI